MKPEIKLQWKEVQAIASLVNNFCIAGSQIMQRDRPDIWRKACANLRNIHKSNQDLTRTLDDIGKRTNEESIYDVLSSLDQRANDAAGILSMTRRCLNVSAFLAHCLASAEVSPEDLNSELPRGTASVLH